MNIRVIIKYIIGISIGSAIGIFLFLNMEKCAAEDEAMMQNCIKACAPLGVAYCPVNNMSPIHCDNRYRLVYPKDQ
jgi:hypothetical protein